MSKSSLTPIRPKQHRSQGWKRPADYRYAAADALVAVCIQELPQLLPHYPLAMVRDAGGAPHLVAILGPAPGHNRYVDSSGHWRVPYIPSHFRGYPFAVVEAPEQTLPDQHPLLLCFDQASGLFREQPDTQAGEHRFFDDQGEPQGLTQRLIEFLKATYVARHEADRAVAALDRAGLLRPWVLPEADRGPSAAAPLSGILRVDAAALDALDAHALRTLQQNSALAIAYAQVFSMPRIAELQALQASSESTTLASDKFGFQHLFGGSNA